MCRRTEEEVVPTVGLTHAIIGDSDTPPHLVAFSDTLGDTEDVPYSGLKPPVFHGGTVICVSSFRRYPLLKGGGGLFLSDTCMSGFKLTSTYMYQSLPGNMSLNGVGRPAVSRSLYAPV